jgi:hypothetical protein
LPLTFLGITRILGKSQVLQYYYIVYCFSYALYLLLVIMATEWFMANRFLIYGYVTIANQACGRFTPFWK